jgi:uncharacterized protein (DUF58 family)
MPRRAFEPALNAPAASQHALQRLDWTVIRRLDGLLQGDYRTLFHGFGVELAELREYQLTDDVRSIDWNVTARMQTPYVRQFVEDRELTAWFLLDLSPSVDFGSLAVQKRTLLVDFVAVISRLLTRHGNRVGAVLWNGEKQRIVPAQGGRMHVLRLMQELEGMPRLRRSPQTNLSQLIDAAMAILRRRSLVFLVSDFLSVPGWEKPLRNLARRHEVLAVGLSDPREEQLPDLGAIVFEDAETGEQLFLDTHDRGFRRRFAQAARDRRVGRDTLLARAAVDLLPLSTEGDMARDLVRFAAERTLRRKAPSSRPLQRTALAPQGPSAQRPS